MKRITVVFLDENQEVINGYGLPINIEETYKAMLKTKTVEIKTYNDDRLFNVNTVKIKRVDKMHDLLKYLNGLAIKYSFEEENIKLTLK